jgi:hypothetical protein
VSRRRGALSFVGAFVLSLVSVVATWLQLAPGFDHVYDLSDESLYLVSADPPQVTAAYVGLFGLYLHPLFAAVGYNVVAYRIVGAVLLLGVGALFAWGCWRFLTAGRSTRSLPTTILITASGAVAAANMYAIYILSPGYNWLCLLGTLLALGAAFWYLETWRRGPQPPSLRRQVAQVGLIVLGIVLSGAGRPPVGLFVVLLVAALVWWGIPAGRRARLRVLALILAWLVVAGILHVIFIADLTRTLEILQTTSYMAELAAPDGTAGIFKLAAVQFFRAPGKIWDVAHLFVLVGFLPLLALFSKRPTRVALAFGLLVIGLLAFVIEWILAGGFQPPEYDVMWAEPVFWMALIAIVCIGMLCVRIVEERSIALNQEQANGAMRPDTAARSDTAERSGSAVNGKRLALVSTILVIGGFLVGVTSNNGAITELAFGGAALLGFAAVLLLSASLPFRPLWGAALGIVIITIPVVATLHSTQSSPYRSAEVSRATEDVTVTWRGSTVKLLPEDAAALNELAGKALAAGFVHGTPLVDVTSFSLTPGIGYRLGSMTPNTLTFGPNTESGVYVMGQQDRSTWCGAWLLRSTQHQQLDPAAVMGSIGLHFPQDYSEVDSLHWVIGRTRTLLPSQLILYKPRPGAVQLCRARYL